jgi:hypothetical protein
MKPEEVDLTAYVELIEAEKAADDARRYHEAEASKYERVRDARRAELERVMGIHSIGLVSGVPVIRKTLSKQFAPAKFRTKYPDLYRSYLAPKIEYGLDMDKLREELPDIVAEFSSLRWTNGSEVLEP